MEKSWRKLLSGKDVSVIVYRIRERSQLSPITIIVKTFVIEKGTVKVHEVENILVLREKHESKLKVLYHR